MNVATWISSQLMKVYIEHMSMLQVLFAFFIDMLLVGIGIIFLHVNPIKTPEMLPSRETPGDFCDVGCCRFTSLEGFHSGLSGMWRLQAAPRFALATFGCLLLPDFSVNNLSHFTASAMVLSGSFLPTDNFYLALIPHILAHFGIS